MNSTDFDQVLATPMPEMEFQNVTLEQLNDLPVPPNCEEIPLNQMDDPKYFEGNPSKKTGVVKA
jgi:hypothetical protein